MGNEELIPKWWNRCEAFTQRYSFAIGIVVREACRAARSCANIKRWKLRSFNASKLVFLPLSLATLFAAAPAQAAYVINVVQNGANVVATGSGSFNTNNLTYSNTLYGATSFITSGNETLFLGSGDQNIYGYSSVSPADGPPIHGPATFGSDSAKAVYATSSTGASVGIGSLALRIPYGYVSGTPISSTATWNGKTLADLYVLPGSYVYSWGRGTRADSFTVNISAGEVSAVPEPATWAMMLLGFGAMGVSMRRRRRTHNSLQTA